MITFLSLNDVDGYLWVSLWQTHPGELSDLCPFMIHLWWIYRDKWGMIGIHQLVIVSRIIGDHASSPMLGYPIWKKGLEHYWLTKQLVTGVGHQDGSLIGGFKSLICSNCSSIEMGWWSPMMRFFQGLKNTKQIFSEVVRKFFFKFSSWSVYVIICIYIQQKWCAFPAFLGGGWVYSYLDMVLVCPESFTSFYLFAVGKSVQ